MEKIAEPQVQIHDLLRSRWSPRAFASRPVEPGILMRLFEAARWAPSSMNLQPWSFVAVTQDDPEAHARMVHGLGERNQVWARHAPVLLLVVAKTERTPGQPNRYAWYDVGQAVAHLSVQATAEGLVLHQMGGFDAEKARQAFDVPAGYDPVVVIALGYLGDPMDLPEDMRAREGAPRSRLPLDQSAFYGRWGNSFAHAAHGSSD